MREENEENAKFRKFANERAPWLVEMFLAETKVSNINEKNESEITTKSRKQISHSLLSLSSRNLKPSKGE